MRSVQRSAVQYSTQFRAVQFSELHCNAVKYTTVQCIKVKGSAVNMGDTSTHERCPAGEEGALSVTQWIKQSHSNSQIVHN